MTAPHAAHPPYVVIIGGGASGVLVAAHLLSDPATPQRVTVIEGHHMLGCGVAYSTSDPGHLLNMRIASLSVFRDLFSSLAGRAVHAVRDTSFVRHATDSAAMTNLLAPLSTDGRLVTTRTGARPTWTTVRSFPPPGPY